MWMNIFAQRSNFKLILSYLQLRDKRKLLLLSLSNISLAGLDLLGVAALGILTAVAIQGAQSLVPGDRVSKILEVINISNLSPKNQVGVLALVALAVFVFKTLISAIVVNRTLQFLSSRSALVGSNLFGVLLRQPVPYLQVNTSQELAYAVNSGASYAIVGILGNSTKLLSDSILIVVLAAGMIIVDWETALVIISIFFVTGLCLNFLLKSRAIILGHSYANQVVSGNQITIDAIQSIKEITVRNSSSYFSKIMADNRANLAKVESNATFLGMVGKYVFEIVVVISAFAVSAMQLASNAPSRAAAVATIFLASISRIAPAALSVQQSTTAIQNYFAKIAPTLKLMRDFQGITPELPYRLTDRDFRHDDFKPSVVLKDVSFNYSKSSLNLFTNVNIRIMPGEFIAVVGPSGAGKSTLVDLMTGVLEPTSGSIHLGGMAPKSIILGNPGAVGFVPQSIAVLPFSIRENLNLGYSDATEPERRYWDSLELAELKDLVEQLPEGLETKMGERGYGFSGGQVQRLGIARALFTNPKIIFMDEATNALDSETESAISQTFSKLRGKITVITVAHRLSTVVHADRIIFIENGHITIGDSILELKQKVPRFEIIAELQGM